MRDISGAFAVNRLLAHMHAHAHALASLAFLPDLGQISPGKDDCLQASQLLKLSQAEHWR